ncbi:MAG: enoyl-CoA hydratase/isomerase family protein [Candidatus Heimdallarchaeota archaeon]|nr:enoyl-CoA hydratase/isomerase family protein [Candidatus Heimdallarchaeota archaeon]
MEYNTLLVNRKETYWIIQLNTGTNAFSANLLHDLISIFEETSQIETLSALILTSTSKIFSVGGDLKAMKTHLDKGNPSGYVDEIVPLVHKVILAMVRHPLPIIVAINGSIAGGGISLGLAADHLVSLENAKFAFAFGSLALSPDSGNSLLIQKHFGSSFALESITQGRVVSAYELSQISHMVITSAESLLPKAEELAKNYSLTDRWATKQTKYLINRRMIQELEEQLDFEFQSIHEACLRPNFAQLLTKMLEQMNKKS